MEKVGFDLDHGPSSLDQKQANPQESRRLSIKRCMQSLLHACQCRDANCRLPSCQKMKRVMQHTNSCWRKQNGGCPICKQLISLCCYHAKHCEEAGCLFPFCITIKHKLKHQQLQARVKQAQMLRRGISRMHWMDHFVAALPPSHRAAGIQQDAVQEQGCERAVQPFQHPITSQMMTPNPQFGQSNPAVGLPVQPSCQPQSQIQCALQQLLQTLKPLTSPQQQQEILGILKSGLQLVAACIKRQAAERQQQEIRQGAVQPLQPPIPNQMMTLHSQPGHSNPVIDPPVQPLDQRQNQIPHFLQQQLLEEAQQLLEEAQQLLQRLEGLWRLNITAAATTVGYSEACQQQLLEGLRKLEISNIASAATAVDHSEVEPAVDGSFY